MTKPAFDHPALHHLKVTPDIVAELMDGMSDAQALAKPAPGEYSLSELLEYLSHSEAHFFRIRLDGVSLVMGGTAPEAHAYDRALLFTAGTYTGREPDESFAHWQERREDNMEALDRLVKAANPKQLIHLEELLRDWAAHDLCALAQIARRISHQLYGA